MNRNALVSCVVLVAMLLAGCGSTPVANDIGQREANEIVAVLRERGIAGFVSKGSGSGARYSVSVKSSNFGEAATLLSRLGLPGERKPSFEEMTASSGIIPSSREVEALRLDRALSAQIEDLLRTRSDVYLATAVVRNHAVLGHGRPAVSVVVQRYPGSLLADGEVKDIVAHSVFGVGRDGVFVSIMDAQGVGNVAPKFERTNGEALVPFLVYWRVTAGEYNQLAGLVVGLLIFASCLAGLAGYIIGQFNWINRNALVTKASAGDVNQGQRARDPNTDGDDDGVLG